MLFLESYPEHPDTIIIQNEFYPFGLKQIKTYNYYMRNKNIILRQLKDRDIIIFFCVNKNEFIAKRRTKENTFIQLTPDNYGIILSGRTISIHSTMNQKESFGIIDLDYHDFNVLKQTTAEIYDYLYKNHNKKLEIRFTGKTGFHIIYKLDQLTDINEIRETLKTKLKDLTPKYTLYEKRNPKTVNMDLSPNKFRGGFITLHCISILGLRCMTINRKELPSFDRKTAII